MNTTTPMVNESSKKSKRTLWAALIVAALLLGAFLLWSLYLSPEAKQYRRDQENTAQFNKGMAEFENRMKNDTYGGKTPEETLNMFIEAVKKDDLELASKYFVPNTQLEVKQKLDELRSTKKIELFIKNLETASPYEQDVLDKNDYKFVVLNEQKEISIYINLSKNTYSGVWKIESL